MEWSNGRRDALVPSSSGGYRRVVCVVCVVCVVFDCDVVVVGAGASGLRAADDLRRGGARVVVLEARDRVGGRTWSREQDGARFDVGGQWLGPTQRRARALAAELGLALFPTHTAGAKLVETDRVSRFRAPIPLLSVGNSVALASALVRARLARRRVDPAAPQATPDAAALDARSLADWMDGFMRDPDARGLLTAATRVVFGADPAEISLLYFLFYLSAAGGLLPLIDVKGGAQQDRFVGGAQGLSLGLAARLGDALRLGAPVERLVQDAAGVTVHVGGQVAVSVRTRRVVLALPPPLTARIACEPAWPAARASLVDAMPMGATTKCLAFYDRAFWREAGLSGEAVSTRGPIAVTFDNTSADGKVPCLVAFIVGGPARKLRRRAPDERRSEVLAALARLFGPVAAQPTAYIEQDWHDEPWSGGCPVAVFAPGRFAAAADTLRAPVGRIHFAGTETATEWAGYIEGALAAGERVAREVLRVS